MHQFMPAVRGIFPEPPDDPPVEAALTWLYESLARDVFSARFALALRSRLRGLYKSAPMADVEARIARLEAQVQAFTEAARHQQEDAFIDPQFTQNVRIVIRAILRSANPGHDEPEIVKHTFPRFDAAVRRLKGHLSGIRAQPAFMMK